jgi:triosephosphate isomerase
MRRPFVAGNWKMNGTLESVGKLVTDLNKGIDQVGDVDVAVCPPFIYIPVVSQLLVDSPIVLGSQNMSRHESGAFTGEISGAMLKDFGCQYSIIGHSERRANYGETDDKEARKFVAVKERGLIPILCVGETLIEYEHGNTQGVVKRQIDAILDFFGVESFENAIIAYEPVWAIGTGKTATPEIAQSVHAFIREQIAAHDEEMAKSIRIIYGGSVNAANAVDLFAQPDIDGGLIGGASLKANDFLTICKAAGES